MEASLTEPISLQPAAVRLILASASPRRLHLLQAAGFQPLVHPPHVPEEIDPGEDGQQYARRLARRKADAVECPAGACVLAADTVVLVDHHVLEKPRDAADARRMLRLLSGRYHEVVTAICLRTASAVVVDAESTRVRFVELSEDEIAAYAASGEPMDKAGAYAIQGLASKFVDRIEGCYFNVVGLPVALVYRHLKRLIASDGVGSAQPGTKGA